MLEEQPAYRDGRYFEKQFILDIVAQAEKGASRKRLCQQYGMAMPTLNGWLQQYGSATYQSTKKKVFSAAEKRKVVQAIIQGRMTIKAATEACHLKWENTVRSWLRTFRQENGNLIMPAPAAMKDKKTPVSESEEIKALKEALAASQLKVAALETMMDIAERELKIDIRKKSGAKQSPK